MIKRIALLLLIILGAVMAGVWLRPSARAQEAAQEWTPSRMSTAALPRAWGQVRGVLGRDEITLVLEDDAGTVRVITLERTLSADGRKPTVTPRLFTVVPRSGPQ
jgi:hypothetical protein